MSDFTPNPKNVNNDEIDLMEMFRRISSTIGKWAVAISIGFLKTVVFLIRRWLPLGISIIIGIAASYSIKLTSDSLYSSDIVLRNNLVDIDKLTKMDNSGTTAEIISKINKLHAFCLEQNLDGLSEAMSMKPEQVKNISDISAYWIIDLNRDGTPDYVDYKDNHNVYDTINIRVQNSFDIRVKIGNNLDLSKIRDGIIKFIERDSLYQQKNNLRLRQNSDMLTRLNYDIKQLDSLQKVKYFEETRNTVPKNGGQIIFMQEQKTQLVYTDIYYLYTKKQLLESERELYKGIVTIISDFSVPTRRENGVMYYGKDIIPVFFVITLLILILIENRKKIKDVFDKY
jgi:hypothetical protein